MDFYDSLLDSDEIGPYFDEVDMKKLIDHQTKFVSSLLGGPAEFADDHLQRAHANLGVTDPHFDEMKAVLGSTLLKHNFDPADIDEVLGQIEARRSIIVA